jgi:hypothetical protein
MSSQEWLLHLDNAPVHIAAYVQEFSAAKGVKTILHPPYSPVLVSADFLQFPKVKSALVGHTLTVDGFKNNWEGVIQTIKKEEFAAAFH